MKVRFTTEYHPWVQSEVKVINNLRFYSSSFSNYISSLSLPVDHGHFLWKYICRFFFPLNFALTFRSCRNELLFISGDPLKCISSGIFVHNQGTKKDCGIEKQMTFSAGISGASLNGNSVEILKTKPFDPNQLTFFPRRTSPRNGREILKPRSNGT